MNENPYLIKLVTILVKRLLKISNFNDSFVDCKFFFFLVSKNINHPKANKIFKSLEELFDNGLKYYIFILNENRDKMNRASPINIYITIRCIQSLFQIKEDYVNPYLDKIKKVTNIFVDLFKRRSIYNTKSNNIGKTFDDKFDILLQMDENFTDENFEFC